MRLYLLIAALLPLACSKPTEQKKVVQQPTNENVAIYYFVGTGTHSLEQITKPENWATDTTTTKSYICGFRK